MARDRPGDSAAWGPGGADIFCDETACDLPVVNNFYSGGTGRGLDGVTGWRVLEVKKDLDKRKAGRNRNNFNGPTKVRLCYLDELILFALSL